MHSLKDMETNKFGVLQVKATHTTKRSQKEVKKRKREEKVESNNI